MNPYLDLLETPAAPDAQKPKNPYLDLLDADEASAGAQRQASLRTAVRMNPDEAAKARGLSKTTGLPEDLVLRNLRDVELQAAVAEADKRLKTAPISAERMRQVPFARIAHDDVDNLVSLESRVRDLGGAFVTGAVAEGGGKTLSGVERFNNMAARGLENGFAALGGDRASIPTIPWWLDPGKVFFGNPGRALKALGGRFAPERPNFATDVASGLGQFAVQAAFAIAAPQASLPALFAQGADAMGEKVDNDPSSQAAKDLAVLSGATLTGLTDKFALDVILGPLAVPIKNRIAAALARVGIASATEGFQETVENIGQDALRKLLTNEKADIEWLDNLYAGGVGATVGGIARGLIESALHIRRRGAVRDQQAAQAEQGAVVLGELNDLAAASKVRARDTESFRAFIDDVAEDGPVPDIYISANALAQSGVTIDEIAAVSESAAEQAAAASTGADIRIPTGEFASTVAGTDLAAKLLPHLKTEPGGMSQAEAQEYLKTHGEELQAEVERALAEREVTDAFKASRDAVQANILGQLKQANRFTEDVNQPYSLLMAARYGVLANQLGITPEEAFNRFPVRIVSQGVMQPEAVLAQGSFADEVTDAAGGQTNHMLTLRDGGKVVGSIDYSVFEGRPQIQMISVEPDARRKGHATRMLRQLQRQFPGVEIDWGMLTDDGAKLKAQTKFRRVPRPETEEKIRRLEVAKARRSEFEARAATFGDDPTPEQREWMASVTDEWNALHDEIDALERDLSSDSKATTDLIDIEDDGLLAQDARTIEVDGVRRPITDSEGRLLGRGAAEQRAFWRWFGDSKVVDAEGKPLRMYHGTGNLEGMEKFDPALTGKGNDQIGSGFYFTTDPTEASGYTTAVTMNAGAGASKLGGDSSPGVVPVYLNIRNPIVVEGSNLRDIDVDLTAKQAEAIIKRAPNLNDPDESPLMNWEDVSDGVTPSVIRRVASNYTGPSLISLENDFFRGDAAGFRSALRDILGYDGVVQSFEGGKQHWVAWFPEQIKSAIGNRGTFDPNDPNILHKGDRRGAFDPSTSTIALLNGADLSTFLHESGHFFLEVQAHLALDPNAPQAVRDDMNTLLDWFGVKEEPGVTALEVWHRMTLDEQREHHEQFARGFEAFLFEGKSPNVEMRGIFQRFRAWLMNVYASIKSLNVKLTDEVRGVMDRMLATEQEIKDAEAANAMGLLFKTPEEAAAFGVEWEAYQEIAAQPTEEAITELAARGVKDMAWLSNAKGRKLRELQKAAAEKRREVRREVQREVLSQPVYRAWQFLTGKDSAEITQPETEAETEFKKELADWEQRRAEREAEATKEARSAAWEASDEAKATFASNKDRGFAKGRFLSKNRKRIDLEVQRLMLDWEAANAKPSKPAKPEPETRGEAVTGKIRTEILREMYGNGKDAVWRKLSARRMTSDTHGSHPDMVAEAFGFASGDEMVQALAEAQPPREAIEAATDQRMLERFGDISSPEALERAVNEAIHNDARQRMVATELAALEKANDARTPAGTDSRGRPRTVATLPRAAKQFAQNLVAGLKVRDIKPAQYQAAAARAAKAAEKALKAGDVAEAAKQKRNQLVNGYAVKAAQQALAEADRARAYLRRAVASKATDREYLDQIEKLLERVELRPISDKAADKRKSLAEWIKAQEALGHEPVIDDALREDAEKKAFRDMTVEEVRGLVDTVRNIEHLGRLKKKLLTAKDKRDFDAIADAAEASIIANGGKARPIQLEPARGVIPWLQGFWASHRKLSSLMRQMDGGQDGIMGDLLVTTANTAGTQEEVMIERATMALADLYAPVLKLKGGMGDKRFISAIGNSLTRAGRLSIALNWGNPQNRQRVMDGDGWTEAQVNAILSTLSPAELQFVNGVWEYLDSFWADVAAKELRVSGVAPEKVEPAPFAVTASDGTTVQMRGGYYPLKYDADRSVKAESQEAAEVAKDMMRGAFTRATTRRGHTKARVENVGRPVRKDLNVITQHVTQVVHDLAWHEWIIDANRLLGDKRVAEAILAHHGPDVLRTLKDDLMGIATADVVPQTKIDRALMLLRANVSRSVMGMSMTTALLQPFGLTQSMVRIGSKHVLRGVARWGGDAVRLENSMTWIGEKSDFMRLRAKTFNRELREISQSVEGKSKTMQVVDGSLFWLMRKMQMVADVPTWIGQYEKSLAEGKDEAVAVAAADRAVLESQGGGQIKDMAEVQRKHPMLTQFYSYFSVTLNLAAESTARTDFRNPRAVAGWLGDMALLTVIPALAPSLIVHALRGGDDDEWPKHLLEWQASYLFGLAVGVRELSGLVSGFDYAGPPVGRVVVDLGKAGQQVGQGEVDEPAVLAIVRLLGSAFGIPTAQAIRSYRGWKAWDEGEAPPTAILFGPPPKD